MKFLPYHVAWNCHGKEYALAISISQTMLFLDNVLVLKVYCCWSALFSDGQPLARHIGGLDARYNSLFMDNFWREAFEHSDTAIGKSGGLF